MSFKDLIKRATDYYQEKTGKSRTGRILGKVGEGFIEGSTWSLYDLPNAPSRDWGERAGYIGGYAASLLNPFNPINKLGLAMKGAPVLKGAFKAAQQPLGKAATKLIAQGGVKKLAGRGLANVSQGLPLTAGYAAAKSMTGQKYGLGEFGADTGIDMAVGSIPVIGALALGAKPSSMKQILANRKGAVGSTLKQTTGLPVSANPATPFNKELLNRLFPNPQDQKLADTVHRAFSVQGKNTFDEVTSQGAIAYYIKNLGRKAVKRAYDKNLLYPKQGSIQGFWGDLSEELAAKGIPLPKRLATQTPSVSTMPQSTLGDIKKNLMMNLFDVDASDINQVRGAFRKSGYIDIDGFHVHPSVDPQWVKDLSPQTKKLMKENGIIYIDPTSNASGMALSKNIGGNQLHGIAVRSDASTGSKLFSEKDAIIAHEIGHKKWRELTPEQQATYRQQSPRSAYAKRIQSGEARSAGSVGEEEFAENFAKEQTGRWAGGGNVAQAPKADIKPQVIKLEETILKEAPEGYLDGLKQMAQDIGLDEAGYETMLKSFKAQKYPELIDVYRNTNPKVSRKVAEVLHDQGRIAFDANQPLSAQIPKIKATVENIQSIFEEAMKTLDAKQSKLLLELKAQAMDVKEFGKLWSELGSDKMPENLKKAMKLQNEITDDLIGISTKEIQVKPDYQYARVWEGSRQLTELVPDTWIDVMNTRFLHHLPRTGKQGFMFDVTQANRDYLERALADRFADTVMAGKQNMNPVEAKLRMKLQEKLGQAIKDDKLGSVDLLTTLKEIHKKFHPGNKGVGKQIIDKSINWLNWNTDTRISNLKKLGIYEMFQPLDYYKMYGQADYTSFKTMLDNQQWENALSWVQQRLPEMDLARMDEIIQKYYKATDPAIQANIIDVMERAFRKVYRQRGEKALEEGLVTLAFTDKHMHANVNKIAMQMLGQGVYAQDLASQVVNTLSRTFSSAMLGLKPKTMMYQIFEAKRLWAETDVKTTYQGFEKAFKEIPQGMPILKKYGLEKSFIEDLIGADKSGQTKNLFTQAQGISLEPMIQSDRFKNAWFLHAFEAVADQRGLKGKAKLDYVMGKFQSLAHAYTGLNVVEGYTNKWIRLLGQFSHYPIKEIRLIHRKAKQGDVKYLAKLAGINATIMYTLGKTFGLSFENVWGGTPGWGPAVSLVDDTYGYVKDMLAETREEEPKYGEVTDAFAHDTFFNYAFPAGGQTNNMMKAANAIEQGYSPSPTDRVRFPAPTDELGKLKAMVFGLSSTKEYQDYTNANLNIPYGLSRAMNPYDQTLGEKQSDNYRTIFKQDPQRAKDYYNSIQGERDDKGIVPQPIGTSAVSGAFGSEGMDVLTQPRPTTIYDILAKNQALDDKRSLISNVMSGKEKGMAEASPQDRLQYLQDLGVTGEDIAQWEYWKASNLPIKDKASLIMSMDKVDWVSLYKNEVISSLQVLEELEKKGFIPDAKSLWEKLKMTDPHERQKADRESHIKLQKDLAKSRTNTVKAMLKAQHTSSVKQFKAMTTKKSSVLKRPKIRTMKKISVPKLEAYKPISFPKL
jgi:hypothetical protein